MFRIMDQFGEYHYADDYEEALDFQVEYPGSQLEWSLGNDELGLEVWAPVTLSPA